MAKASLYPPSPKNVPEDLTEMSSDFKTRTLLVLFSLLMFFALYFGLMFFCLAYTAWAIFLCPYDGGWFVIKIIAVALALPFVIQFIYMAKNLFRYEKAG